MFVRGYFFRQYLEALWNFKRTQKRHTRIRSDQPAENLSDLVTIFYGHNMKNGSMFGFLKKLRRDEKANKTAVQYMDKNFLHQNNFCSPGAYCVKQEEHTDAERSAVFKA